MHTNLRKIAWISVVALAASGVISCKTSKPEPSPNPAAPSPAPNPVTAAPKDASAPSVMLATHFPGQDRTIYVWSFQNVHALDVQFGGSKLNLKAPSGNIDVKFDIKRAPKDQIGVEISAKEGSEFTGHGGANPPKANMANANVTVGGVSTGPGGKPVSTGDLLTGLVQQQGVTPGQPLTLAKGVGAFPSITAVVGGK